MVVAVRHGASERTERPVLVPARVSEPTLQSEGENTRLRTRTLLRVISQSYTTVDS